MLQIIINPVAGNGRATQVGSHITEALTQQGVAHAVMLTEYPGHATALAREAAEAGADTVMAIGGDGTVLEVGRGLQGQDTALAIIPAGTGNDVVKMLGIPATPAEALEFFLTHPARALDAGRINETLFLNVCGTGFDVVVLDYALSAKKYVRGMLPYLWGVLRTIFTYKPVELTISVDGGEPFVKKVLLMAIANGRFIGGGMEVAPSARPDDGLFDLILIDAMPRRKMPVQLPKLLSGKIREIPGTAYRNCTQVVMRGEGMRVNIDGEIVPMAEATFAILPGALWAHW